MTTKPFCFVIMPIKDPATEFLWDEVYSPIIKNSGFVPERIDKEEDGSVIPKLIMEKIILDELIIADLTLARPNCYFELGYAYGIPEKKDSQIIVCCREDHCSDSDNYNSKIHKVHFDFSWRNIIWWEKEKLEDFKTELASKINSRWKIIEREKRQPEEEGGETGRETEPPHQTKDNLDFELEKRLKNARGEVAKNE